MKTKLTHVRVNVSNLAKSVAWYESILGFENDGGWVTRKFTIMDLDGNELGFVQE